MNHGIPPRIHEFHQYADLAIAGVELRVWQRYSAPDLIYVRACASTCPGYSFSYDVFPETTERWWWTPLGTTPVPLDDGFSSKGTYRYGNVVVAVAAGNPGLLSDREYLLALRDALGGGVALNWSASSPTTAWEGVKVEGVPARVTPGCGSRVAA